MVCGHDIGQWAFIGAGAVITKDVPDYALVVGNPARQTGWMSRAGYRLEFGQDGTAVCPGTGEKYLLKDGKVTLIEHNNPYSVGSTSASGRIGAEYPVRGVRP